MSDEQEKIAGQIPDAERSAETPAGAQPEPLYWRR